MKNDVSDAKQEVATNCTLEDIELTEKGVHSVWRPDENGDADYHIEDWSMEAYYAYYNCTNCGDDWVINAAQDKDTAWKLVKEHINA